MTTLTQQEIKQASTFMNRMLPFLLSGMSFEDAGNAVLKRDRELFEIAMANNEEGENIRKELAKEVYEKVRAE